METARHAQELRVSTYRRWDAAFRGLLSGSVSMQDFSATARDVSQALNSVSAELRQLEAALAAQAPQHADPAAAASVVVVNATPADTAAATSAEHRKFLLDFIPRLQRAEGAKFRATAELQQLAVAHLRGPNAATHVHAVDGGCALWTRYVPLLAATQGATFSAANRDRVTRGAGIEASSSSSDDDAEDVKKAEQTDGPASPDISKSALSPSASPVGPYESCEAATARTERLLADLKRSEEALRDLIDDFQAALSG